MRTHVKTKGQYGYTMIEMAIAISVVGIMLAGFMTAYSMYLRDRAVTTTNINSALVSRAINSFLLENGRYPCPAAIDAPADQGYYGEETDCSALMGYDAAGASAGPVDAGECENGICVETSTRNAAWRVVRGAVPFRALNMPEDYAYDGYGSRLYYVVTSDLTNVDTYDRGNGGIAVVDGANRSMIDPAGSAHFLIYSPGRDRIAAYTKYGKQVQGCDGAGLDVENCNTLDDDTAVYRAAQASTAVGAQKFDDVVTYSSSAETPFWRVADDDRRNIQDLADGGRITIGSDPDATLTDDSVRLDVSRVVKSAGQMQAKRFCDKNGENCFDSELIGGDREEVDCAALYAAGMVSGPYMKGIANGQAECTNVPAMGCPAGEYVSEINADGTFKCSSKESLTPPPDSEDPEDEEDEELPPNTPKCPAKTITMCSGPATTYVLPEGINGQIEKAEAGFSYYENWKCRARETETSDKWEWKWVNEGGECSCVSGRDEWSLSCMEAHSWYVEGGRWTGRVYFWEELTCNPDTKEISWTEGYDDSACRCVGPYTESWSNACPMGQTGQQTWQHTWTCSADNLTGSWSPTIAQSNTCACQDQRVTRTQTCPVGQTGVYVEERIGTCVTPTGTTYNWGAWTPVAGQNFCQACDPTVKEVDDFSCPYGAAGEIIKERYRQCPSGSWGAWQEVSNSCAECEVETETRDKTCPTGQSGIWAQQRTRSCPEGTWGAWTDTVNTCAVVSTCTPGTEDVVSTCPAGQEGELVYRNTYVCNAEGNRVISGTTTLTNTCTTPPSCTPSVGTIEQACPAGQTGALIYMRTVTCDAGGNPVVTIGSSPVANNCTAISYQWKPPSQSISTTNPGIGVRAGTTCTAQGAKTACYRLISGGNGMAENFNNCECQ